MQFFSLMVMVFLSLSSYLTAAVKAYVTNGNDYTVSVIDTATNTVVSTIAVGYYPTRIAGSVDGKYVYVPAFGSDILYTLDTVNDIVAYITSLPSGSHPMSTSASPSGKIYVANFSTGSISVCQENQVVVSNNLPVGGVFPFHIVFSPDDTRAYLVCGLGPKNIKSIDTSTGYVVGTANAGQQSFSLALSPSGSTLYVSNPLQNSISVINTSTLATTTTIGLAANSYPRGIAFTPNGLYAYVALQGSSSVAVIDTATNTLSTTIALTANSEPFNVAITPDGLFAYVTQTLSNTVSVIDTSTNTVVGTIPVGHYPFDVAIVTTTP